MRIDLSGVSRLAQSDLIGVSMPASTPTPSPTPSPTPTPTPSPSSRGPTSDTTTIAEDASVASVSGNVLANGAAGFTLSTVNGHVVPGAKVSTLLVQGEHGTLTITKDGDWTYALNNQDPVVQALGTGETRTETFTYVTTRSKGAVATSTLKVTINGTNDAPVAIALANQTIDEDQANSFELPAFGDVDGDSLNYTAALAGGSPLPLWLAFDSDTRQFAGTPPTDFHGTRTVKVTGSDGAASATTTFSLNIAAVEDAPLALDGTANGDEDGGAITGQVSGADVDSPALSYSLVEGVDPSSGTLVFNEDGTYSFVPAEDFNGKVTFTWTANDGTADSNIASTVVAVAQANDAPVAASGTADGLEDAAEITGAVVATDVDGDDLSYSLVEGPAVEKGTLAFNEDGTYSFVPAEDFNGEVTFTWTANDGTADSNTITETISITPGDEEPPVVSIEDATAWEAVGSIEMPVTLSYKSDQDVTLSYEVDIAAQTITFDGLGGEHSFIGAGYGRLRWTGITASGDGAALTATTGGGKIQALAEGELSLASLTVSTASAYQVVTVQAIRAGEVVSTKEGLARQRGAQSCTVSLGADFANIDAVHIDGMPMPAGTIIRSRSTTSCSAGPSLPVPSRSRRGRPTRRSQSR